MRLNCFGYPNRPVSKEFPNLLRANGPSWLKGSNGPQMEAYHRETHKERITEAAPSRYRGVSYVKPITAAKEAVSVLDLADMLCGPGKLRKVGDRWTARCPLPDHEDNIPSFVVYPETESWYCFACLRGGDVVELARLAWGYDEVEAHSAAAMLLMEFGYEPPSRPPTYFRKQERQEKARDAIKIERIRHIQMLVFRLVWVPWLKTLPESTREDAKRSAWENSDKIAKLLYAHRRSS
jgi:hypothetical protein